MKKRTLALLLATHGLVGLIGFGLGIYALPILIAPPAPSADEVTTKASQSNFTGEFHKNLEGSDRLHWGEGKVTLGPKFITFMGQIAPGPDYKLYLSPEFVQTEADFNRLKHTMAQVGDVKTFDNFIVELPNGINPAEFNSVIVWCESFGEFITAAQYR